MSDQIFEAAGVGLAIAAPDGTLRRVNRAYAHFLGYEPGELHGRHPRELVSPDSLAGVLATIRTLAAGTAVRVEAQRQYRRRDGTLVWGLATVTRLPDGDGLVAAVQDIGEHQRAEAALRALSARLLRLQDEERRRIARSLHESAAQTVAALSMHLQRLEKLGLPRHALEIVEDALGLATQASREVRTLSHLLHPPLLEETGLRSSVAWFVAGFAKRSNVEVNLQADEAFGRLPMEVEIALFRVVQESLTNVHRHAHSQRASVRLSRSANEAVLEVRDEGIGMAHEQRDHGPVLGVGIAGMRERVSQLGGALEILDGNPGTVVRARFPCEGA